MAKRLHRRHNVSVAGVLLPLLLTVVLRHAHTGAGSGPFFNPDAVHSSISELAQWNGLSIGKSCVGWSRTVANISFASNSRASSPSACDLGMGRGLDVDGLRRKWGTGYAPDREDSHHDYSFIGERATGPTVALFACMSLSSM